MLYICLPSFLYYTALIVQFMTINGQYLNWEASEIFVD
jgi:hypothetical protein